MLRIITLVLLVISFSYSSAQNLPNKLTESEKALMPAYLSSRTASPNGITVPPASPVRTIGEWEELQGLLITWTSYQSMLKEIVRYGKLECPIYIVTNNAQSVISYLATNNIDTVNVRFLNTPYNSVWSRDYGPWSAYTNEVDTLITIDWIYNRPRPLDDVIPAAVATVLNTPLYQTTSTPWDLVHTGGNFMTDGAGTGFSSNLIVNENPNHTVAEIDTIMNRFMGINRYIKMNTLPYDAIHHIDMHMKLLDEETILMGEYPAGVADGPQIEANLLYVISNYNSVYGTPYKVIRIPMPADNGQYPDNGGNYYTYTNSSFINKTIIVPTYNIPADTTALRIYRDALPGYNVVGINSTASIGALGALHCITKELGTDDPLLIRHQPLPDTYDDMNPYLVSAYMKHRSGIASANLYYRTDTLLPYTQVPMNQGFNPDYWLGYIPAQAVGTEIYYYVQGSSVSGKTQVRPLPAPAGYWKFKVLGLSSLPEINPVLLSPFPNPSKGITCIPVQLSSPQFISIDVFDAVGNKIQTVYSGNPGNGEHRYFINTTHYAAGVYGIRLSSNSGSALSKLIVQP